MQRKTRNAKFVKKQTNKQKNFVMCQWMFETWHILEICIEFSFFSDVINEHFQ